MGKKKVKWLSSVKKAIRTQYKAASKAYRGKKPSQETGVDGINEPENEKTSKSQRWSSVEVHKEGELTGAPSSSEKSDSEAEEEEEEEEEEEGEAEEENVQHDEREKREEEKKKVSVVMATPTASRYLPEDSDWQRKHALAVASATAAAAEAAAAAAKAAAEVVRLTNAAPPPFYSNSNQRREWAAMKIQAGSRGYLARRALRALKGRIRLQALVQGVAVQRQSIATVQSMHALVQMNAIVQARRAQTSKEGHLTWQGQQQCDPIENPMSQSSEGWNDSIETVEAFKAKKLSKHEAAQKHERALAYAKSHQHWKSSPKHTSAMTTPTAGMLVQPPEAESLDESNRNWIENWTDGGTWGATDFCEREGPTDFMSSKSAEEGGGGGQQQVEEEQEQKEREEEGGSIVAAKNTHRKSSEVMTVMKPGPQSSNGRSSSVASSSFVKDDEESVPCYPTTPPLPQYKSSPVERTKQDNVWTQRLSGGGPSTIYSDIYSPYSSTRDRDRESESLSGSRNPPVPRYMSTTESAKARAQARSQSAPRQRPRTPEKTQHPASPSVASSSARKRPHPTSNGMPINTRTDTYMQKSPIMNGFPYSPYHPQRLSTSMGEVSEELRLAMNWNLKQSK